MAAEGSARATTMPTELTAFHDSCMKLTYLFHRRLHGRVESLNGQLPMPDATLHGQAPNGSPDFQI